MTLPGSIIPGGLNRKLRDPPRPPDPNPLNQIKNNLVLCHIVGVLKSIINHKGHEGEIYIFIMYVPMH
jgi:hypothetical protein